MKNKIDPSRLPELRRRIQTGESYRSLALDFPVTRQRIQQIAGKMGHTRKRSKSPFRYENGKVVYVLKPDHPKAYHTNDSMRGYVPAFYLAVERVIGRPIKREEQVRFVDGNKENLDPSNIRIFSSIAEALNAMRTPRMHGEEVMLDVIRYAALKAGVTPRQKDFAELGYNDPGVWTRYFGSMPKAMTAAGLLPRHQGRGKYGSFPLPTGFREKYNYLLKYPDIRTLMKQRKEQCLAESSTDYRTELLIAS